MKSTKSHSEIFTEVYKHKKWGTNSGPGSGLFYNLELLIFLKKFFYENNITSVVDIGCGYWGYARKLYPGTNIHYTGIDCVPVVIEQNSQKYKDDHIDFLCLDVQKHFEEIPNTDLCVIKDVFQHWVDEDIREFLEKWKKSKKSKQIIIVNCYKGMKNYEINETGSDLRGLDSANKVFEGYNIRSLLRYNTKEVCLCSQN